MRAIYRQRYRTDAYRGGRGDADPRFVRSEPDRSIRPLGAVRYVGAFDRFARGNVWSGLRSPDDGHLDGRSLGRCRRSSGAPAVALGRERRGVNGSPRPILSTLVVAHDEERQLTECLACLGFADEIIVVL